MDSGTKMPHNFSSLMRRECDPSSSPIFNSTKSGYVKKDSTISNLSEKNTRIRYLNGIDVELPRNSVNACKVELARRHNRFAPEVCLLTKDPNGGLLELTDPQGEVPEEVNIIFRDVEYDDDKLIEALLCHARESDQDGLERINARLRASVTSSEGSPDSETPPRLSQLATNSSQQVAPLIKGTGSRIVDALNNMQGATSFLSSMHPPSSFSSLFPSRGGQQPTQKKGEKTTEASRSCSSFATASSSSSTNTTRNKLNEGINEAPPYVSPFQGCLKKKVRTNKAEKKELARVSLMNKAFFKCIRSEYTGLGFDFATMRWLLEVNADVNFEETQGNQVVTPFCLALGIDGQPGALLATFLIRNGADQNHISRNGESLLSAAVSDNNIPFVQALLYPMLSIQADCDKILTATPGGKKEHTNHLGTEHTKRIITTINQRDHRGWSPLYTTCYHGYTEICTLMLNCAVANPKLDVNMLNRDGWFPLSIASYVGHTAIVEELCFSKANVDLGNTDEMNGTVGRRTALNVASYRGNARVIEILCSYGADVNAVNDDDWCPISLASHAGHDDALKVLRRYEQSSRNNTLCLATIPNYNAYAPGGCIIM